MRILAVDLGKVRTGLAVCDEGERLASPACVVQEYHRDRLAAVVAAKAEEYGVGEHLRTLVHVPVWMQDERGTTITAHGYLNDTDTRGKKRKAVVDAVAATIILEDYLMVRRNRLRQLSNQE